MRGPRGDAGRAIVLDLDWREVGFQKVREDMYVAVEQAAEPQLMRILTWVSACEHAVLSELKPHAGYHRLSQ